MWLDTKQESTERKVVVHEAICRLEMWESRQSFVFYLESKEITEVSFVVMYVCAVCAKDEEY